MRYAALMLAAMLLASCESEEPAPTPTATSVNHTDVEQYWPDGQPK